MADTKAEPTEKRRISRREVVVVLPAIGAPRWLQGFVDFIREQGVVGLAVGLILGVAAKSVVDSLVQNIFNPLLGLFYGGGDFSTRFICLKTVAQNNKAVCQSKLGYGNFINTLISFVIVAAAVYFIIKMLKLDKLYKKKEG